MFKNECDKTNPMMQEMGMPQSMMMGGMDGCCGCPQPIVEPMINKVVTKEVCHTIPHICPVNTHVVTRHIFNHTYTPQYTCTSEDQVCNMDCGSCCQFR